MILVKFFSTSVIKVSIFLLAMTVIRGPKLSKDKGYSWVIVFTSFLSHFANIGFSFGTAGNLTMAHQDYFNVDLQIGSFIGTAHISVLLLFGKKDLLLISTLH